MSTLKALPSTEKTSSSNDTLNHSLPTTLPTPNEQKKIIADLDKNVSNYRYCVSLDWKQKWTNYTSPPYEGPYQAPHPGPVDMSTTKQNSHFSEQAWVKLVEFYGLSEKHMLSRVPHSETFVDSKCDVMLMSHMPTLRVLKQYGFCLPEEVGYIELQLRRLYSIPFSSKTRLWVCSSLISQKRPEFELYLNRYTDMEPMDRVAIMIEISNIDGTWASQTPGEPTGTLNKYSHLLGSDVKFEAVEDSALTEYVDTLTGHLNRQMKVVAANLTEVSVKQTSRVRAHLEGIELKLNEDKRQFNQKKIELMEKEKELRQEMKWLDMDKGILYTEQEELKKEKADFAKCIQQFNEEKKRMNEVNKMTEHQILLNVGGQRFMTSKLTLTTEKDSMFSAMFSGRYELKTNLSDGSHFIDRDGTHFRYILNYLRDGGAHKSFLPTEASLLKELYIEAEYYGLQGLIQQLQKQATKLNFKLGDEDDTSELGSPKRKIAKSKYQVIDTN